MRFRPVFWSGVIFTPVIGALALIYGRRFDDHLGGRLLQMGGTFIGLGWSTWMFLEVGQAVTRLFHLGRSEETSDEETSVSPTPKPARPPLRRAA